MRRLRNLFYSQPTPPVNDGLGKATKSLNEAIKELEIAIEKLEEVGRLRKEMANQLTVLRESSTSRRSEEEDLTFHSTPVYTANAIVPVLITTFFKS